jgi:hypothetical protein
MHLFNAEAGHPHFEKKGRERQGRRHNSYQSGEFELLC